MTADEVEKYITQIAFSGATQFLEKYKDKTTFNGEKNRAVPFVGSTWFGPAK